MTKPSIVFAHGLWADGSCFQKLIPTLQADGHEVMCSQHGLNSLKSDVECVIRCFGRVKGPVVLVGHSYGGTLITHAGMDDRVAALVYIAALAPDETETSQGQQQKFPVTDVFSHIEVADGRIWLKPDGVSFFAATCQRRSRSLFGRPRACPCPTCLCKKSTGSPGRESRAGSSSAARIAPCIPNFSAPPRSAWAQQLSNCAPVMFRCSPSHRR
jgi:pimeloyl-ACP methyl ester carboxylesterase